MQAKVQLRLATPADRRFIAASWFESYRKGGHAPEVGFDVYRAGQDAVIQRCMSQGKLVVAAAEAEPDEICGWVCAAPDTLHYAYVKQAYRRLGIALSLFAAVGQPRQHTHDTRLGRLFARKTGSRYNPFLLHG